jgi:transcriptional regulator with XRE-family HTH domain
MKPETLGALITRRLNDLNMSKAELARRIGKSPAYVGDLANDTAKTKSGKYDPSPEVIDALAYHLQISREEILVALDYLPQTTDSLAKEFPALMSGYEKLSPENRKIARKQIQGIIRTLVEAQE